MPTERLSMRRIRDLLRLNAQGLSSRAIAASLSISKGAVGAYLSRVRAAGLSWPLPSELDDDDALELLLFPGQSVMAGVAGSMRWIGLASATKSYVPSIG